MKILVIGASGSLGRHVSFLAVKKGYTVLAAGRRKPPDLPSEVKWVPLYLESQSNFHDAFNGIDAVIHCATNPRNAKKVDFEGMRRLTEACRAFHIKHFVYVSIVGVDEIPLPYYRYKYEAERILSQSGLPFSLLRATQFHDFIAHLLRAAARFPFVMPIPAGFQVQSVAPVEVAQRLLQAVQDGPCGRLPDFGGPQILTLRQAAEIWKQVTGIQKPIVSLPLPGAAASAFRSGKNLLSAGEYGKIKWAEWLKDL